MSPPSSGQDSNWQVNSGLFFFEVLVVYRIFSSICNLSTVRATFASHTKARSQFCGAECYTGILSFLYHSRAGGGAPHLFPQHMFVVIVQIPALLQFCMFTCLQVMDSFFPLFFFLLSRLLLKSIVGS